jgi:hypothetical protein
MTIALMTLLVFESGCSWFRWQRMPDEPGLPAEQAECIKGFPIADTIVAGVYAILTGILLGAHSEEHCSYAESDVGTCGLGEAIGRYIGIGTAVITAVFSAAAITGWVNYHQCREYQKRYYPELFQPPPPPPDTQIEQTENERYQYPRLQHLRNQRLQNQRIQNPETPKPETPNPETPAPTSDKQDGDSK